jgi:hypothetical protein
MMIVEPMPYSPVDDTRGGVLKVDCIIIEQLLGLAPGNMVEVVRANGHEMEVLILGKDMPPLVDGKADPVMLLLSVKREDGIETIEAHWMHVPDKRWEVLRRAVRDTA